jgi:arylsulfatase A-like enzyme
VLVCGVVALATAASAPAQAARPARPNIVFILADDLSTNLLRYMPNVLRMQREGVSFTNYFVTNSLCCPSRASILTGQFPHDHEVLTNTAPFGGFEAFSDFGSEDRTFATALQDSGYRTGMLGKYLNGYHPSSGYVPPGWSLWNVPGNAYDGFGYVMSENGRTAHFGKRPRAYVTDVLSRRGRAFVSRVAKARKPFLLELASFAPHHPYTPAPRHAQAFPWLAAPRTAAFDAATAGAPEWLAGRGPLNLDESAAIDRDFRKRAQSVLALDELVGAVRATLKRRGLDKNTYVVFSSDNGFHMGEHRLTAGKMTAFDTDIRVPLIVVGPGVPAGEERDELVANVDLAPTFMGLAGVEPPRNVDGHALVGLLHGEAPGDWRDAVLIEHHRPEPSLEDPDIQARPSGTPPSYSALRTRFGTYVEYATGEREYYDLRVDPDQLENVYDRLDATEQESLAETLAALRSCHRADTCWAAAQR